MAIAQIKCNGDEVSEECVWSNAYGPSEDLGVKENWCYKRVGWLSRAECVEERMVEEQLVKRIKGYDLRGVRLKGRPQTDCMDGMKHTE